MFEGHVVTEDETWVHHYDPETKRQSQQWLSRGAPPPEKAIRKISRKKVMALILGQNRCVPNPVSTKRTYTQGGTVRENIRSSEVSHPEKTWRNVERERLSLS